MSAQHKILDFIKPLQLTTLATASTEGKPEAATIEFAITDDFRVIFDTCKNFRKYPNLLSNPNVALVFSDGGSISVQLEGRAEILERELLLQYQEIYLKKNPDAKVYTKDPNWLWFCILPTWARYTDISIKLTELFEVTFCIPSFMSS